MANYANLLATIAANIYTNGNNEVTAAMVKTAVDSMVASLGAGYQFMGVATPATNPGTPDAKVFYLASEPGVYTNFGGVIVGTDGLTIIKGSGGTWATETVLNEQPAPAYEYPFIGTSDYTSSAATRGFWPAENVQNQIRGKTIGSLAFNVKTPGTLSILIGKNIGTASATFSVYDTITFTTAGIQGVQVSPFMLAGDEWLGWYLSTDTCNLYYNGTGAGAEAAQKGFWYYTGSAWSLIGTSVLEFAAYFIGGYSPRFKRLAGKRLAILGDSISTYAGMIPTGYVTYYPTGDVDNVNECYWKIACDESGMTPSDTSWSGSKMVGNSSDATGQCGCSTKRIADLGRFGSPDIVLIYMGTNDWGQGETMGDWDPNLPIPSEGTITEFSSALALAITKIQTTYPAARIFVSTLMPIVLGGQQWPLSNPAGEFLVDWNNKIREISTALGADILDLSACGINRNNVSTYYGDGAMHPNAAGHELMAQKLLAVLAAKY